jgi:hypothetical protein
LAAALPLPLLFIRYFKMKKDKDLKTILVISTGFLLIYFIYRWEWALIVSFILGVIGIFSSFLTMKINFLWMKLTYILSLILPNILLFIIFYLILFPIALISRMFDKDPLLLKNNYSSYFSSVNKTFDKKSFENPW